MLDEHKTECLRIDATERVYCCCVVEGCKG